MLEVLNESHGSDDNVNRTSRTCVLCLIILGQRHCVNDGPPLCILLQGQLLTNIAFALMVSMSAKCLVINGFFLLHPADPRLRVFFFFD